MRKLARSLVRLYPANWRERYGEEFEALLEDSSPGWAGVFDLLKGAMKMQLNTRSFPKLAGGLAVVGMLAGLGISFSVTPRYVSTGVMQLVAAPGSTASPDLAGMLQQLQQEVLSRSSLSRMMQDPIDLYQDERARVPLEDVIERMRTEDIRIRVDSPRLHPTSLAFHVSFAYRDAVKARQTVGALMFALMDYNLVSQRAAQQLRRTHVLDQVGRMEARIAALEKKLGMPAAPPEPEDRVTVLTGVNLDVLDPPSLPIKPVYPNRAAFLLTGFGTGFVLAVLIAIFRSKHPPIPFPAQLV